MVKTFIIQPKVIPALVSSWYSSLEVVEAWGKYRKETRVALLKKLLIMSKL